MKNVIKAWRDAATLIVLAKQKPVSCSYDILLQTRTSGASSFANGVVFPGGVSESADGSEKWVDLIKSYGYNQQHFNSLHRAGPLVPLFESDPICRHISLRITAIRETFEETGLLLCSRKHCDERVGSWGHFVEDFDTAEWRKKICKDPLQLFNLCEKQNCYPDIWSLHYWSNWLSPVTLKKRFDTAFFVVGLENKPGTINCNSEASVLGWHPIEDILERNRKLEARLFPPQFYELNRFRLFRDLSDLVQFASDRSGYGTDLLYPYIIPTQDGAVYLLPGDDHYPVDIDYNKNPIKIDKNTLELRQGAHTLHRLEIVGNQKEYIFQNYKPLHHITLENCNLKLHTYDI